MTTSCSDIEFCIQKAKRKDIYEHLKFSSDSFNPPLESYVDIADYSTKIRNNAITFEAWYQGVLIGLAAAYFNNTDSKISFLTSLSVLHNFQGKGIGKELLIEVISYGKNQQFEKLNLEAKIGNSNVVSFYQGFGFNIIGQHGTSYLMSYDLMVNNNA